MGISNKRRLFIAEYLKDFNGAQAAIRAGYSKKTARTIASALLTKIDISAEIKARIDERAMKADEVIQRLSDIARGDLKDLLDISSVGYNLSLLDKDGKPKEETKLIKKVKQKSTTFLAKKESEEDREVVETEIELYSSLEALALLGKFHKLFVDRTEFTGKDGEPIKIDNESSNRAISTLVDALREIVSREGTESDRAMGPTK